MPRSFHSFRHLPPLVCVFVCLSSLVSTGCGILLFPIEGPKILITNTQHFKFHVDIVDEQGTPLNDVQVEITHDTIAPDLLAVERPKETTEPQRTVNQALDYDGAGGMGLSVRYWKVGYAPNNRYYNKGDSRHWGNAVDIRKFPVTRVVLVRSSLQY